MEDSDDDDCTPSQELYLCLLEAPAADCNDGVPAKLVIVTSNSPEEDDKESAVEAFPLLDDPSHSVTAWKATHRCPVTDFFGKPKVCSFRDFYCGTCINQAMRVVLSKREALGQVRYYIPKGAEIHSIGHVVCPKTHRLWIKFLSDDGFEEWAAATSSTGQQVALLETIRLRHQTWLGHTNLQCVLLWFDSRCCCSLWTGSSGFVVGTIACKKSTNLSQNHTSTTSLPTQCVSVRVLFFCRVCGCCLRDWYFFLLFGCLYCPDVSWRLVECKAPSSVSSKKVRKAPD